MIKKIVMTIAGVAMALGILSVASVDVKAALPSSYDIITDANGKIMTREECLAQALMFESLFEDLYNTVKDDPCSSELDKQQAYDLYVNARNVSRWWYDQVNNAKTYLKNINDRAAFEDKFAANRSALADLTKLQKAKQDADGAVEIANGVAKQIADVKSAIAGYEQQLATSPSVQSQIDSLKATLAELEADYAAKLARANELTALFNNYLSTLGYASYDKAFEDYQYNREIQRNNPDWDPTQYNTK